MEGRHPIVEKLIMDNYVPNSVHLSEKQQKSKDQYPKAIILTGPNMGGKTYENNIIFIFIIFFKLFSLFSCFYPIYYYFEVFLEFYNYHFNFFNFL